MTASEPYFSAVSLTPSNLEVCRPMWGDRGAYEPDAFERVLARVRWLLERDRARGRILRDEQGRSRAFGVSAFVAEPMADRLSTSPTPRLGRQLLEDEDWESAVLTRPEVGRGNAGSGLQLLVVNQGYDDNGLTDEQWGALLGSLIQAFIETHRGFRISRAVIESFGTRGTDFISQSWPRVTCDDVATTDGGAIRSARWVLTQEIAEKQGGGMLPLFLYRRPALGLSDAEQAVLLSALTSGTDSAIAQALDLPLPAVKSRWSRIFRRVAATPLGTQLAAAGAADRRGPQNRHILLDYVRRHPWELTPFAARDGKRRRASSS